MENWQLAPSKFQRVEKIILVRKFFSKNIIKFGAEKILHFGEFRNKIEMLGTCKSSVGSYSLENCSFLPIPNFLIHGAAIIKAQTPLF